MLDIPTISKDVLLNITERKENSLMLVFPGYYCIQKPIVIERKPGIEKNILRAKNLNLLSLN